MGCFYVRRRFTGYSDEKKRMVKIALNYVIYCPVCREIHKLEDEENENK